ncbi:MAG: hypothetical protein VX733_08190 [Candidatus Latescibacterota bacterium]|nr:hypothetical protein [Candidatus Latescibacterota bacterium]
MTKEHLSHVAFWDNQFPVPYCGEEDGDEVRSSANEIFDNVTLEGCASGALALTANSSWVLDIIRNGDNGLSFPLEDRAGFIQAARRIAENELFHCRLSDVASSSRSSETGFSARSYSGRRRASGDTTAIAPSCGHVVG